MDKKVWQVGAACLRVLMVGLLATQSTMVYASSSGRVNASGAVAGQNCGNCHTGGAAMTSVAFGGVPASVTVGSVNTFTFTVSDSMGMAATAGLNISATGGMLGVLDANTQFLSNEITHKSPAAFVNGSVVYTFTWMAPASPGTATLYGAGVASNGNNAADTADGVAMASMPINVIAAAPTNMPPTASFTSPATGTVGVPVTFDGSGSTDMDGTISSWNWNFGDGGADATGVRTIRSFTAAGTYTVQLTVTDDKNATASTTRTIVIAVPANMPPTASFTGPTAGSVGIPVTFDGSGSTDMEGAIAAWNWNFGDSGSSTSIDATGMTPTKTYMTAGTYTVQLTVVDNMNATATTTRTIVIAAVPVNMPPTASFTGPTTGSVGMSVTFDGSGSTDMDGTIADWSWNFGDGMAGTQASGVTATYTYAKAGTYPVTLTVRDNMGVTGSVTKNIVISDVVSHLPPVADAGGPYTGIVGVPVAFDGSKSTVASGLTGFYTWDFGDNTPGITISVIKPMHVYTAPGTYTVTLKVIDDGTPPLSSTVTTTATITAATPPPTTPPSTGQQLYDTHCASCHGPKGGPAGTYGSVSGSSAGDIREAIEEKSAMRSLSTLTANEIFAIAAYLKPAPKPTRGERLYNQYCASCHGAGGTGGSQPAIVGAREALIKTKIRQQTEMASLKPLLKKEDAIEAIAKFLGGRRDDIAALGDTSDTDDTFLNGDAPASETVKVGALDWLSMMGVAGWALRRRRKQ